MVPSEMGSRINNRGLGNGSLGKNSAFWPRHTVLGTFQAAARLEIFM